MNDQKMNGLGKGLASIWNDLNQEASVDSKIVAVEIPVQNIEPNPDQPRKYFDQDSLDELKASIQKEGVLQPILVRTMESEGKTNYQIIAGERRWRASQELHLPTIPAILIECDQATAIQLGLIENLQRENISPMDEAASLKLLMDDYHKTPEDVADILSKSVSYVRNSVRLLKLPPAVQAMLRTGKISTGHARAIIESSDPVDLANQIIQHHLTVRDAENLAKKHNQLQRKVEWVEERKIPEGFQSDAQMLEEMLSEYFQTTTKIRLKGEGGMIQILFNDFNQLDEIFSRINAELRTHESHAQDH